MTESQKVDINNIRKILVASLTHRTSTSYSFNKKISSVVKVDGRLSPEQFGVLNLTKKRGKVSIIFYFPKLLWHKVMSEKSCEYCSQRYQFDHL